MMKHSKKNLMCRSEIREALMAVVLRCAVIESQWRMLRGRGLATVKLTKPVRLAVLLLARRAEHNCGLLADRAIFGLAALDEGVRETGECALADCLAMISFDKAADRAAAILLRNPKPGLKHGQ